MRAKPVEPYAPLPAAPLGSFTLIERGALLYSARCSSPFPHGEPRFVEDRIGPPSRAYRELWELFTLTRAWPARGERCVDLGAAPGGWTWALAKLGAEVLAVDKAAPLAGGHLGRIPPGFPRSRCVRPDAAASCVSRAMNCAAKAISAVETPASVVVTVRPAPRRALARRLRRPMRPLSASPRASTSERSSS